VGSKEKRRQKWKMNGGIGLRERSSQSEKTHTWNEPFGFQVTEARGKRKSSKSEADFDFLASACTDTAPDYPQALQR